MKNPFIEEKITRSDAAQVELQCKNDAQKTKSKRKVERRVLKAIKNYSPAKHEQRGSKIVIFKVLTKYKENFPKAIWPHKSVRATASRLRTILKSDYARASEFLDGLKTIIEPKVKLARKRTALEKELAELEMDEGTQKFLSAQHSAK
jgi:hypothetical protein